MQQKRLMTIFAIISVDLLGFGLILPLIPFYAGQFGATATLVGLLIASYAVAQLVGAPWLGRLSDRYGRRPVLLISVLGTGLGFVLLGAAIPLGRSLADVIPMGGDPVANQNGFILFLLFVSRILDGLTGGNISVAQAYVADVTTADGRAKGMGMIGAASGVGLMVGPALGGALSQWGFSVPAYAAAGLAFLNLIAVLFWLPESLTKARRAELARQPQKGFRWRSFQQTMQRPRVGALLYTRLFFALAFATFHLVLPLYVEYRFGFDEQLTGYMLAYAGVLIVLVQGVLIGRITAYWSDNYLIVASVLLMAPSLFAWAFAPNVLVLLLLFMPIALSGSVLGTVVNSALSQAVQSQEIGGILGLSTSLDSVSRVFAPFFGGLLLQQLGTSAPGVFSTLILVGLMPFVWRWFAGQTYSRSWRIAFRGISSGRL